MFNTSYDCIVVGSGAGGMTATLVLNEAGLDVLLIEKSRYYGGSSALSGGGIWVPNNMLMQEEHVEDSIESAKLYLDNIVGDKVSDEKKLAYVEKAPEMLNWLIEKAKIKFTYMKDYADYHPEQPGGSTIGRGVEPKFFNGRKLGKDLKHLRPPIFPIPLGMVFNAREYKELSMIMSTWKGKVTALKIGLRTIWNLLRRAKMLSMGQALIGWLRYALKQRDVPLWLNCPLKDLIIEGKKVVGVIVEKEGKELKIGAKKGVILAAGGFPHNLEMRKKYQKEPITTEWSVANSDNTGDVIQIGQQHGAKVDLMDDAWWGPVSLPPDSLPFFHVGERGYPGGIMVNKNGKRFVNESASYVVVVHVMYEKHTADNPHIPAYFIFDQRFKNRYMFGMTFPRQRFPKKYYESGYIKKASTLEELAEKVGINKANLVETVKTFNEYALQGKDLDFHRGDSAYDNYYGDPKVKPNPNLAPLNNPPFYCVEFWPGDLGTKGGLLTNKYAQVLNKEDKPIEGLYATGNCMASVMGNSYPGPGGTIGPSMTFGYIAAKHIINKQSETTS